MAGHRAGFLICPDALKRVLTRVITHQPYHASTSAQAMGIAAAGAILGYCLYTMGLATRTTHGTEHLLYTAPLVAYGILRYLYRLQRGLSSGQPTRDLLRDPHLLITVLAWLGLTVWLVA